MCFFYALSQTAQSLKNRYQLKLDFDFESEPELTEAKYYISGFEFPRMPVITNQQPGRLQGYTWGLIPFWVKTPTEALEIRTHTLNARSDTIFTKPSFRNAIRERRCLVPADGFYEWREAGGKKYPYFIYRKDRGIFSFAGIWEEWIGHSTGEVLRTFSILTTDANPLMEQIHNTKKRMPVILPREKELDWLRDGLGKEEIVALTKPLEGQLLSAHPISKLINSRTSNRNVAAIQEVYEHPGLSEIKGV